MSIGTLLAYTIVSASVIILRYKTDQNNQNYSKGEDEVSVSTTSSQSEQGLLSSQVGKLKPQFWWLRYIIGECGHNVAISGSVLMFVCCCAVLWIHMNFSIFEITNGDWWAVLILIFLIICSLGCLLVIGAHQQKPSMGTFRVPWVPLLPGLSILFNVGLMIHLNVLTWVRFTVWMILGFLVYFLYGIKHSKENYSNNTYSMLITSSEAHKETWGTMSSRDDSAESGTLQEQETVQKKQG